MFRVTARLAIHWLQAVGGSSPHGNSEVCLAPIFALRLTHVSVSLLGEHVTSESLQGHVSMYRIIASNFTFGHSRQGLL